MPTLSVALTETSVKLLTGTGLVGPVGAVKLTTGFVVSTATPVFCTETVTELWLWLPAASKAWTSSVWVPGDAVVVSQV
jgi:hypothetical protein